VQAPARKTAPPEGALSILRLTRAHVVDGAKGEPRAAFPYLELQEGHQVLDLGCGTGDSARVMAQIVGAGGYVVGIDDSAELILEAEKRGGELGLPLDFRTWDRRTLPFPDQTFDRCHVNTVLQHVPDPNAALLEIVNVTRRGGVIAVTEPDWETYVRGGTNSSLTQRIIRAFCDSIQHPGIAHNLPALFADHGLSEISVVPSTAVFMGKSAVLHNWMTNALLECALATGAISDEEATAWRVDQEERARAGHAFSAITSLRVTGRRH
jgi:ubiquinone/menaquinone biosynthesis C-methylase UbiE